MGRGLGVFGTSPCYYFTVMVRGNVWVTPPPVAVTVTVEVFADEPPQAVSWVMQTMLATSMRAKNIPRRFFQPRKPSAIAKVTPVGRNGIGLLPRAAEVLLEIFSVVVVVGGVIDAGVKVQVTPVPVQENVIAEVNVAFGVTVMVIVAGVLEVTVAVVALAPTLKLGARWLTV